MDVTEPSKPHVLTNNRNNACISNILKPVVKKKTGSHIFKTVSMLKTGGGVKQSVGGTIGGPGCSRAPCLSSSWVVKSKGMFGKTL